MTSTEIILHPTEIMMAGHVGMMRQVMNIKKGAEHRYGASNERSWQLHIEGAIGEYVLAKHLHVNWTGVGEVRAPDVGVVDVRTTASHNNRLIIHQDDKDDRQYWLVAGLNGVYRVQGWLWGRDAKQEKYLSDPTGDNRPAYFVPVSDLNPPQPRDKAA